MNPNPHYPAGVAVYPADDQADDELRTTPGVRRTNQIPEFLFSGTRLLASTSRELRACQIAFRLSARVMSLVTCNRHAADISQQPVPGPLMRGALKCGSHGTDNNSDWLILRIMGFIFRRGNDISPAFGVELQLSAPPDDDRLWVNPRLHILD